MSNDRNPFDAALRANATRHKAPPELRARIWRGIDAQMRADAAAEPAQGRFTLTLPWFSFRGLAAGFAMGAFSAVFAVTVFYNGLSNERLDEEMVAGHVRALITGHLSDVISTDQHTVKPWFAGKLEFSPPVWNARPQEFPLLGGRVDYVDHHPAAALVYKRKEHVINVFVWPQSGGGASGAGKPLSGYNTLRWSEGGMQFWAVSDIGADELAKFRDLSLSTKEDAGSGS